MAALLVVFIVGISAALSLPLGLYMKWAMDPAAPELGLAARINRIFKLLAGPISRAVQNWRQYLQSMLLFNACMFGVALLLLALQQHLPLNPDHKGPLEVSLIFNIAASFTSNTNLQHYSGEVSLSYFSQLCVLMWLQFVSAATGLSALTALARGLSGRPEMGNFYIDMQRAAFLILLPIAFIVALLLVWGGVPMTLSGAVNAITLEGAHQEIARGPVAAFLAIKQLGTNGGGFFGANSAHPFENPTFLTNMLSAISILLIPMACVWMFGHIIGRIRHARILFAIMSIFLIVKIAAAVCFESAPTRAFARLAIEQQDGNFEGKELRFGAAAGPLWSVLTTSTSNGSVNAMQDSLNPLTGLVSMIGMWLNSTFGGVGVGMINMFIYVIIAVFVAGMMVGRTPEYLGRRIEAREIKLTVIAFLAHPVFILLGTAVFAATSWRGILNSPGPHGFSEILYEFSSAAANNGSGFEGLADNAISWNVATGVVMLLARFIPIILPLAVAGSLAAKPPTAESVSTLGVEDTTFGLMLSATIIFVGALTFVPVAILGPIAEQLLFMR